MPIDCMPVYAYRVCLLYCHLPILCHVMPVYCMINLHPLCLLYCQLTLLSSIVELLCTHVMPKFYHHPAILCYVMSITYCYVMSMTSCYVMSITYCYVMSITYVLSVSSNYCITLLFFAMLRA